MVGDVPVLLKLNTDGEFQILLFEKKFEKLNGWNALKLNKDGIFQLKNGIENWSNMPNDGLNQLLNPLK